MRWMFLGMSRHGAAISATVGSELGRGTRIRLLWVGELELDGDQGVRAEGEVRLYPLQERVGF